MPEVVAAPDVCHAMRAHAVRREHGRQRAATAGASAAPTAAAAAAAADARRQQQQQQLPARRNPPPLGERPANVPTNGRRPKVRDALEPQQQPTAAPAQPEARRDAEKQLPEEEASRARKVLRAVYSEMKADVIELRARRKLWDDGKHYRTILVLSSEARSKDVVAMLKRKVDLWSPDARRSFTRRCKAARLLQDAELPWGEKNSDAVAALYSEMKADVKQRVAEAAAAAAAAPAPAAAAAPAAERQPAQRQPRPPAADAIVAAIPVVVDAVPVPAAVLPAPAAAAAAAAPTGGRRRPAAPLMQEMFPFPGMPSVACGGAASTRRRSGSAPHVSIVSGVVAGLPTTGVPLAGAQRIVHWPEPLIWNVCYTGDLDAVKKLVRDDHSLLDQLGYMKTKPTSEITAAQRLGVRRVTPDGERRYYHAVLPAPPGDDSRATPLHFAVLGEQTEVVRWLLKKGAALEMSAQQGPTALQLAARPERPAVRKLLLKEAENREQKQKGVLGRLAALF